MKFPLFETGFLSGMRSVEADDVPLVPLAIFTKIASIHLWDFTARGWIHHPTCHWCSHTPAHRHTQKELSHPTIPPSHHPTKRKKSSLLIWEFNVGNFWCCITHLDPHRCGLLQQRWPAASGMFTSRIFGAKAGKFPAPKCWAKVLGVDVHVWKGTQICVLGPARKNCFVTGKPTVDLEKKNTHTPYLLYLHHLSTVWMGSHQRNQQRCNTWSWPTCQVNV